MNIATVPNHPLDVWSRRLCTLVLLTTLAAVLGAGDGREAGESQSSDATDRRLLPMMFDPELTRPAPEIQFDRRNIVLWLAALQRPEVDTRLDAIEAFAAAHRQGVKDLNEALPVIEKLLASDPHIDVRQAAGKALIEFDHKPAAGTLQRALTDGSNLSPDFVLAVDAALARWRHNEAIHVWIARLPQCAVRPTVGISAIRSLASVRAKESGDAIVACVLDRSLSPAVRLEAARALPLVGSPGRSKLATELASEPGQRSLGPLVALIVLGSGHDIPNSPALDSPAITLVESLASHSDPRVRAHALSLLRRAEVSRALAKTELLSDLDDQVRLEAVRALADTAAAVPVIAPLSDALDDVSESVRVAARAGLRERWKQDSSGVQQTIERALSAGRWRETEQAAVLAGELHVASVAGHLEALLTFERAEVRLAACISLRLLDLKDSLPALVTRAEALTASAHEAAKSPAQFDSDGQELAQIFMTFAQHGYRPAADLLKKYIPKRSGFQPLARGAAIYALGKIFEKQPIPELVTKLTERAEDNNPVDPEAADVRRFSAIALGRMGAHEALPVLHELYEAENSTVSVGGASRWAIMHMESVDLPPCRPVVTKAGPFFLESIGPSSKPVQP